MVRVLKTVVACFFFFFAASEAVYAQVSLSTQAVQFGQVTTRPGASGSESRTISLRNDGASAATIGAGSFSGISNANTGFSVTADSCQNISLDAGANCDVTFKFDPLYNATLIAAYGWTVDGVQKRVALMNDNSAGPALDAAQRRLPPVVQKVSFFAVAADLTTEYLLDGVNPVTVDGKTIPGDKLYDKFTYRMKWFVTSYDPAIQMEMAAFDCGPEAGVTDTCAQAFSSNFLISNTKNSNGGVGTVLTPAQSTAEGLPTYSFGGASASNIMFTSQILEFSVVAPAVRDLVAVRFYQRGDSDRQANDSYISAILPGGLDILGRGSNGYLGNEGRRILFPVEPCPVAICPTNPDEEF